MKMNLLNHNKERKALNPFKIENRDIYPIVDILTISDNITCNIVDVMPLALVVEEDEKKYVINLSCFEINEHELFKLVNF